MWNKIYLIGLAATVLTMGILLYFPYGWLQSKTNPRDVQANYLFYSNISWTFLLISSLILLIAGNVLLWKTRRSWATWASFLYFAIFTIAHKFWLDQAFFSYQKTNYLTESIFTFGALSGAVLIVLAAVIVFFNQYLVKRLHDKMYPAAPPIESLPEESVSDNKDI
jgi:multisubunit Na+/H+ antiporter MnhB subunit